ncbi:hypothetical protein N9J72_01315 [Candidatus Gracilibacteria bacterium]|nr:hypothetical protein [Candidatus Gracilibacteria bacterium]
MSRKKNHPTRKIQRFIQKLGEQISFRGSHMTFGAKITLFGIILSGVSLFFSWVHSFDGIIGLGGSEPESFSSFSSYTGNTGFFILSIILLCAFSILSTKRKEKIRFFTLIQISDIICCVFGSIMILILSLQSYFFIQGLQAFSSQILYGKGIIFCITSAIIMLIGALIMRQEYRKNIKGSYIRNGEENLENQDTSSKKDNMILPF